ncbi:MAG: DedA family protein [Ignavibacteriaceae bacterium]
MFEELLNSMSSFSPLIIFAVLLIMPFVENIFPPAPSDFIVALGGTLIVAGTINLIPALILTSIGSEVGFLFLYYLGSQTDKKLVRKGKVKFISAETLNKAETWFQRFGFLIILFNRFIPGIRSVISFFAGLSELNLKNTIILSSISSVLWNIILLSLGIVFANNLNEIDYILSTYSYVVLTILGIGLVLVIIKYIIKKKSKSI